MFLNRLAAILCSISLAIELGNGNYGYAAMSFVLVVVNIILIKDEE